MTIPASAYKTLLGIGGGVLMEIEIVYMFSAMIEWKKKKEKSIFLNAVLCFIMNSSSSEVAI